MPNPVGTSLYVNQLLTNVLVAYVQSDTKFVAQQVFPRVPVEQRSGIVPQWDRGDMLRDEMQRREPGSAYNRGGMRTDNTVTFYCNGWGLEFPVPFEHRQLQSNPYDLDRAAAIYLAQKKLIKMESDWVTNFFTTSVWTGSSTATDLVGGTDFGKWNDSSSTPIDDIKTQARSIEQNTGFYPNTLVCSRAGWDALSEHPDVVDRLSHNVDRVASTMQVGTLLAGDLEDGFRVVVAKATNNTADEGLSASMSYLFGKHALLCYAAPSPSPYIPSAGYTFEWTAATPLGSMAIETYTDVTIKSDIHRIDAAYDFKAVAPKLGAFFQTVTD